MIKRTLFFIVFMPFRAIFLLLIGCRGGVNPDGLPQLSASE
jgi:hypothetical protein